MEEAKARIEVIDAAIGGRLALPDMIMEEFVYGSFGCCANSQRLRAYPARWCCRC